MPRKLDVKTELPAPHGLYDRPPTPGDVIQVLILEPYRMTVKQLARRLKCAEWIVQGVVDDDVQVLADFALRLSVLTGTSPNIWLDMQRDVNLYDDRKSLGRRLSSIEPFPSPLRLRKLVMPTADDIDSVRP